MNEKVASDFLPVFAASKLGPLCGNVSESTKFRFLKEFKPFSDLIPKSSKRNQNFQLSTNEKSQIKSFMDINIDSENLRFNDQEIMNNFKIDTIPILNSEIIEDNLLESDAEEYFTAESDEESFITANDKKRNEFTAIKSLNALRFISTSRGNKLEKSILERTNEEKQMNFIRNKTKKYKDFNLFKIVGIIDGISAEHKCILEIKTRSKFNKNKDTITKSEKIQALVYMNMHECDKCLFVECGSNGEIKQTMIDYDDFKFQNEVIRSLEEFCYFAQNITQDELENLIKKYSVI
ncbi:hypothetical protein BpHYR1_015854 [Brachionus plicatilis]|uniref:YqaJ viral recombinase domain-containing protein n=1 Tax=Brachionus plicatilis TaxID=10195 RepID=A0A3M7RI09_BRAPC|nr:hypothetical protein BpHYR1_015854 [Brachionus plicatilis]